MTDSFVFEVSAADFDSAVVTRSAEVPVLLDFWADWCEPCRALGPVLEKLAGEYGGGFVVGKVDTEKERDLAYAFQVQSIPMCVLLVGGRPVDAFSGAIPEREIREFLKRGGVEPAVEAPEEAEESDPDAPSARLKEALAAVAAGEYERARERLGGIPDDAEERTAAARVLDGLSVFDAELDLSSGDAADALGRGRGRLREGDLDGAVEALLESVAADKAYAGQMARKAAVLCFELMSLEAGGEDRVAAARRRLATLLY